MKLKKILPPTFLLFAIILVVLLYYLYPLKSILIYPWYILGIIPIIFGISINLIADQIFKSRNTTIKLYEQSSTLVTTGIFKFTRNPMYLGFVFILLGITIMMGALTPFIVVPIFATFVDRYCINIEEKMLNEIFGDEWENYKAKTRRWFWWVFQSSFIFHKYGLIISLDLIYFLIRFIFVDFIHLISSTLKSES